MRLKLATLTFIVASGMNANAEPNVITSEIDGEVNIDCTCTNFKYDGTHSWTQPAHLKVGMEIDLSRLCYNKRDVNEFGAGLCVEPPEDASDEQKVQYFDGKLQQ